MARRKKQSKPVEPKAPNPEKKDSFKNWQARIERGKKLREHWETTFKVRQCAEYYLGKQKEPQDGEEFVVLNHFLATAKTERPNLFIHNPKYYVRPKPGREEPAEERTAALGEGVLEAIATQDDNLEKAANLAITQSYFRLGVVKVVYDPKLEPNPRKGEPMWKTDRTGTPIKDPATIEMLKNPETGEILVDPESGQPIPDPGSGDLMPLLDENSQQLKEPEFVLTDEVYRYVWVNAKNLILPDNGPDDTKWPWIAEEITVPIEEAREDSKFPEAKRRNFKANAKSDDIDGKQFSSKPEGESDMFRYIECWDIRNKRWKTWTDGQGQDEFNQDFIFDEPLPDGIEDHPYFILNLGEPIIDPDPLPWPLPHTHSWLGPQREYNIRRNQMMQGAKRAARKGIYFEGSFDEPEEAMKVMQSPKDMEFAKCNSRDAIPEILETPPLNADVSRDIGLLQIDWRLLTGQTGARLSNPDSNTATEASFVERSADLREAELKKKVDAWLSLGGRKMLQLVKATLTIGMYVKMRGFSDEEYLNYAERVYGIPRKTLEFFPGLREIFKQSLAREKWMQVPREDLQFEADVTVVPGTSRPRNLEMERQQWFKFIEFIGRFPQLALSRELLRETGKMFEGVSERMIDELHILALKMIEVNARQAGRNGEGGGASAGGGQNPLAALLSQAQGAGGA